MYIEFVFGSLILVFLGLLLGSFMNALEYRLAHGRSISTTNGKWERSHCPHCTTQLLAVDLVPVVSFLILRGRCRACSQRISWQYPVVEAAAGLIGFVTVLRYGWGAEALVVAVFGWILLFIFLYDYKHQLILDKVTVPSMLVAGVLSVGVLGLELNNVLIGALIGGGFFWMQYVVSRGKWIGGGDIRLGVLMGLMLGWQQTLAALLLAYVGGSVVALVLITRRTVKMQSHIAFGTFLTVATFVCLLFGQELIDWYIGLL